MPLKCHRDECSRKKEGQWASTGSHRQHCVWGRELHFTGTAGLKVKDYFEICIPYHQTLPLQSALLPPPCSRHSLSRKIKSCRHRAGDELGADPLWWQKRILLFPNPHITPSPPPSPYKSNWRSRGFIISQGLKSYLLICFTLKDSLWKKTYRNLV